MYKILLVDDEQIICDSIKSKINRIHHEAIDQVEVAYNPKEAIKKAQRMKPDIMIVDMKMPMMTGIELIQELRQKGVESRFMILSGHDEYEYIRKAFKLGAYDYLLKPISIIDLKERLNSIIEGMDKEEKKELDDQKFMVAKPAEGTKKVMDVVEEFIQNNYHKNITLAEVSNTVSLNYCYLSQLFKEELGKSYSRYLTEIRMGKAVELLKDPLIRISSISEQVGYTSPYHFSRSFKKFYGVSPKKYRENQKSS